MLPFVLRNLLLLGLLAYKFCIYFHPYQVILSQLYIIIYSYGKITKSHVKEKKYSKNDKNYTSI